MTMDLGTMLRGEIKAIEKGLKGVRDYRIGEVQARYAELNRLRQLLANEVIASIEAAEMPKVATLHMRRQPRKTWAPAVRELLKGLGIRHVSVTTPSYSMASTISIRVPGFSHDHDERSAATAYRTCPRCQRRHAAVARLERLILAAFPDLNDRSDMMTDHFDYCLSIR